MIINVVFVQITLLLPINTHFRIWIAYVNLDFMVLSQARQMQLANHVLKINFALKDKAIVHTNVLVHL